MINIYCDESCHLENDDSDVMVLGAIWFDNDKKNELSKSIRGIKEKYGVKSTIEVKWTKVGKGKLDMYLELIDLFFNNDYLHFRALVAKDKKTLDHNLYNQGDHDLWYYKLYFLLIDKVIEVENKYQVYIDIKDTNGGPRLTKLKEVLCNNKYDFIGESINGITQINSNRSDFVQLADLLIGALSYYHRGLYNNDNSSPSKNILVKELIDRTSEKIIDNGTSRYAQKFNIFIWKPNYSRGNL